MAACQHSGSPLSRENVTYQEALEYIYSFSDFEHSGHFTRDPKENIPREARLLEMLGNPQQHYSSTLIAGTKGKGSTAAFIERVLRQAGLRTGLYTQPDLHTFRERIRINGGLISQEDLVFLMPTLKTAVDQVEARREFGPFITYELMTALALLYFARQEVDHAVLEVGLGGRLDATNVTRPLVSVLTSISYDHMQVLGNTLTQIATEKAAIIKPHGIAVTSAQAPEALLVITAECERKQARLVRVGPPEGDPAQAEVEAGRVSKIHYRYRLEAQSGRRQYFTVYSPLQTYAGLEIGLAGQHQLENATTAVAVLEALLERGVPWDDEALRDGLKATYWPGRMEVVGHNPTIVVDGAHNADSLQKLMQGVKDTFHWKRQIVVFSASEDKDLDGMVKALKGVDLVMLTQMRNPRVASLERLRETFRWNAPEIPLEIVPESEQALDRAKEMAGPEDLICVTGSLYLTGEALRWAAAHGDQEAARGIEGMDH